MQVAPNFVFSHTLAYYCFSLLAYLDDMLFVSYMGLAHTRKLVSLLCHIFSLFGVQLNDAKCLFVPSSMVIFLGYEVQSSGHLQLTGKRLAKCYLLTALLLFMSACHCWFLSFR